MASTYLTKTFSSSPTNAKKGTVSVWIKLADVADTANTFHRIFATGADSSNRTDINIDTSSGRLAFTAGGTNTTETNRLLRDQSAFYHLVISYDTTQATASDRVKFYINGVQETSFLTEIYPSQNADLDFGNNSYAHHIGNSPHFTPRFFHGIMSHFHYVDGTAYDATAFGQFDANGVWTIKTSPSVTYGTNGFFILEDSNSVTDQSGNGNNWTVAGGTLTNTEDNPSNVFATLNPLDNYYAGGTFTHGNNTVEHGSSPWTFNTSTLKIPENTKFYCEGKVITMNQCTIGIQKYISTGTANFLGETNGVSFRGYQGDILKDDSLVSGTWSTFTTNDIIQIACDTVNNKLYFGKNGTWLNNGDPTSGASGTGAISITDNTDYFFAFGDNTSGARGKWSANFGNGYFGTTAVASAGTNASGIGIFEYDVPTGYTALSTKGLNL